VTLAAVGVSDALDSAVIALRAGGVATPRLDAEVLLAWSLGTTRTALHTDPDQPVRGEAVRRFQNAVRRRAIDRQPVAYIVGSRGFRHIELEVDPRVLIPRPETELLVEVALELPAGRWVHDLGTGSGAIALALKHERPDLRVSASDCSPAAVEVAAANARRLGLEVELSQGGWEHGVRLGADALLCNPPYVAEAQRPTLAPELGHEPAQALWAGPDGLEALRVIADALGDHLRRGDGDRPIVPAGAPARVPTPAMVALEVGQGQAPAVRRLLAEVGLARTEVRLDLAGIERVVLGWVS